MAISPVSLSSQNPLNVSQFQTEQTLQQSKALKTEEAFQDFVAGTFFKMMLKSMRSTQDTIQYMGGGDAEKTFRGQLDQQIAEDLAREHGDVFAAPLYPSFRAYLDNSSPSQGTQLEHLA